MTDKPITHPADTAAAFAIRYEWIIQEPECGCCCVVAMPIETAIKLHANLGAWLEAHRKARH